MKKRLLIVGAGGHGRSVAEAATASGVFDVVGFLDDSSPSLDRVWYLPVFGATSELADFLGRAEVAIVAIGNNRLRKELQTRLVSVGFEVVSVLHPRAIVSPSAVVAPGCSIMAGAIVGTEAQLGEGVIVNCGAVVDHHCRVESFGHLGVNASMAGGSVLGLEAWMQAGSALGYQVQVDAGAVLMPGSSLF